MDEKTDARVDESSSVKRFCVDCKHHELEDRSEKRNILKSVNDPAWKIYKDVHWCYHQSFQTIDVVTGEIKANEKECSHVRNIYHICGENAILWEPKEEKSNE